MKTTQLKSGVGILSLCLLLAACGPFHVRYTDQEAVTAILAADGSGSGLDADLLDGKDSSEFLMASEEKWVDEAGDTMTGPLEVRSDVTAKNYLYDSPRSGHTSVAGAAFIPGAIPNVNSGVDWVSSEDGYGYLRSAAPRIPASGVQLCTGACWASMTVLTGAVELRADVVLPEKSKVTAFSCFWYDLSFAPGATYSFKLMKRPWYDLAGQPMATVSGSTNDFAAANAVRVTTTNSINDSLVDTMRASYYISGSWGDAPGSEGALDDSVRFYGCLTRYELSQAGQL